MKKRILIFIATMVALLVLAVPTLVMAHSLDVSATTFYACEAPTTIGSITVGSVDVNSITQDNSLDCSSDTDFTARVQWSVTGPQGNPGPKGDTGLTGPAGMPGTNGNDGKDGAPGTNGSNVSTSDSAPTGACITGDTDVDLSTGEVWSCVNLAWQDTNHTIKGDKGDTGNTGPVGPVGPSGIPFTHAPCAEKLTGPAQQENLLFCLSGIEPDGSLVYHAAINAAASARIIIGTPIAHTPSVDWSNRSIVYIEFTSEFHAEYHSPENIVRIYNAANQRVF